MLSLLLQISIWWRIHHHHHPQYLHLPLLQYHHYQHHHRLLPLSFSFSVWVLHPRLVPISSCWRTMPTLMPVVRLLRLLLLRLLLLPRMQSRLHQTRDRRRRTTAVVGP